MLYGIFSVLTVAVLVALGIKWEIKIKTVLPWALLMAFLGCVTLMFLNRAFYNMNNALKLIIVITQVVVITSVVVLMMFFRDPQRVPPHNDGVIVSPADGKVLYIKEIKHGDFPFAIKRDRRIALESFINEEFIKDRGFQIGIGMNFLNVHINRAPIPGVIRSVTRIEGRFHSLKKTSSLLENERVCTIIKNKYINVAVVQIASRLVRRIYTFIAEGEQVKVGQKIGVIKFGSQVDMILPYSENIKFLVKQDEEVKAGDSIIATYNN